MAIYLRKKTIMIILIVIGGLLLIGGGVVTALYLQDQLAQSQDNGDQAKTPRTAKTVCNEAILIEARDALGYPVDTEKLAAVATKIKALDDYQYDVNCLYVALQQDLTVSDASSARIHLDVLKGLYVSSVGYSPVLNVTGQEPSVLEKVVSAMEKTMEDFVKGDDQIKGPTDEPPLE